jgi:hypothetical protein
MSKLQQNEKEIKAALKDEGIDLKTLPWFNIKIYK